MYIAGIAVLGIALISMGEEVGAEMSYRTFGHLVGFQDLNYWLDNLDLHYIYRYILYDFVFIVILTVTIWRGSH